VEALHCLAAVSPGGAAPGSGPRSQLALLLRRREPYANAVSIARPLVCECLDAMDEREFVSAEVMTDGEAVSLVRRVVAAHLQLGLRQVVAEARVHAAVRTSYRAWVEGPGKRGAEGVATQVEAVCRRIDAELFKPQLASLGLKQFAGRLPTPLRDSDGGSGDGGGGDGGTGGDGGGNGGARVEAAAAPGVRGARSRATARRATASKGKAGTKRGAASAPQRPTAMPVPSPHETVAPSAHAPITFVTPLGSCAAAAQAAGAGAAGACARAEASLTLEEYSEHVSETFGPQGIPYPRVSPFPPGATPVSPTDRSAAYLSPSQGGGAWTGRSQGHSQGYPQGSSQGVCASGSNGERVGAGVCGWYGGGGRPAGSPSRSAAESMLASVPCVSFAPGSAAAPLPVAPSAFLSPASLDRLRRMSLALATVKALRPRQGVGGEGGGVDGRVVGAASAADTGHMRLLKAIEEERNAPAAIPRVQAVRSQAETIPHSRNHSNPDPHASPSSSPP
jgi:hypothetical protein